MPEATGSKEGGKLPEQIRESFEVRVEDPDSIFRGLIEKPQVRISLGKVGFEGGRSEHSYLEVGAINIGGRVHLAGSINLDKEVNFNEEAMISGLIGAVLCAEGGEIKKEIGTRFSFETSMGTEIQIGDVHVGDALNFWIMTFELTGKNLKRRNNFDNSMEDLCRVVGLAIDGVSMVTGFKPASNEMVLKAPTESDVLGRTPEKAGE